MANEKGRVMIVDDSHATLTLLANILKGEGFDVRPADSGERALAAMEKASPELILLDIHLTGIDGFEVLRRLRERESWSQIPVIFLSGSTGIGQKVQGLKLGASDFIEKPFHREELLARVNAQLELVRLREKTAHQAAELRAANDLLRTNNELIGRQEKAFRRANEKLNLLNSITRHDALNQIMLVDGYSVLLENTELNSSQMDTLGKIRRSAAMLRKQMEFTRLYQEIGVKEPSWQRLHAAIEVSAGSIVLGDLEVINRTDDYEVWADPMMEKVIFNLIDNAVRHSGGARHIMIGTKEEDGTLIIEVGDDGIGVSPEDKPHLFTRGYGKNTGFGLFLSREILGITAITISEESAPGEGARFVMRVPPDHWRRNRAEKASEPP